MLYHLFKIMMKKILSCFLIIISIVSCEKDVFTGIVESPMPNYGKIFISSNPGGYKIFVDDKNMGVVSPDTVLYLTEGQHKLNLRHDFYTDTTMTISVNKSDLKIISIDMLKNPRFFATVTLSSIPSAAKIYLNDQLINNVVTPATIRNIYPGKFEVKLIKKDCRDDSLNIVIKGGEFTDIQRILEDTSRTVSYRTNNSKISSNVLSKVVVDKFNNKWIGSIDRGLMKFDGKNWTSFENNGVIEGSRVQDLLVDKKGIVWVATIKGLFNFNGITWKNLTNNLPSQNVTALGEDYFGNIWIGTPDGLIKYDNNSFQIFTIENTDVPLKFISSISASSNGDVWIGTSVYGFIKYNAGRWTLFNTGQRDPLSGMSNQIADLIADMYGTVWIYHEDQPTEGKAGGLTELSGNVWMWRQLPLLFQLKVTSFYLDDKNNIWMAISGGLIRYNEAASSIKVYDSDTYGFFSSQSTSFCIDINGDGWLTTLGGGITKIKKSSF